MKTFEDFKAAFPKLYADVRCGFNCPPGWLDIVWRLSEKLEPLGAQCDQVKEKFGGLHFYLQGKADVATNLLIHSAEEEAANACAICGKPGTLGKQTPLYIRTLCPEHTPADVEQDVPRVLKDAQAFEPAKNTQAWLDWYAGKEPKP